MDEEFTELVDSFRDDAQEAITLLQLALDTQDRATVGNICHKLKSSSQLIGAFEMAEFTRQLEHYKHGQPQQEALALLQDLRHEFGEVQNWLDSQSI